MMYFLDPVLYSEREKGLECLADFIKGKIIDSANRQIKTITLVNIHPEGEA